VGAYCRRAKMTMETMNTITRCPCHKRSRFVDCVIVGGTEFQETDNMGMMIAKPTQHCLLVWATGARRSLGGHIPGYLFTASAWDSSSSPPAPTSVAHTASAASASQPPSPGQSSPDSRG
jgi:hypothetical protein